MKVGGLAEKNANMIIVACTEPNRMSVPVPASRETYANENAKTYRERKRADTRLVCRAGRWLFSASEEMTRRASAPEIRRTVEKLAASIEPSRRASRHRIEFMAKAVRARVVLRKVLHRAGGAAFIASPV
jgi:hypothetical protein